MKHDESFAGLNVLVIGWYGAPNVGDEVLLDVLKTAIESKGGTLTVASVDPALTREMHGVESVDFHNLGELARALLWADVLIMGGGGIFQDHHAFHLYPVYDPAINDISAYARPILMARQFGVPVLVWGHGVGPLESPDARELVRDIFNGVTAASVRDEKSLELLREIGVDQPISIGADPGWLYKACCIGPLEPKQKALAEKKTLAIVVREWTGKGNSWRDKLRAAIERTLDDGWKIQWIAFQANVRASGATSDLPMIEEIRNNLPDRLKGELLLPKTPREAWDLLASADAIFSMRLHASILGLLAQKPLVGLEYDEKMAHAHTMAGMPDSQRLRLEDAEERYIESFRLLTGQSGQPWSLGQDRIEQLQQSARAHLALLDQTPRGSTHRTHWAGGQFDWLSTWLQQSIADLRETKERSRAAHELLHYRDYTLDQREAELRELQKMASVREKDIADARNESMELQKVLAKRDEEIAHGHASLAAEVKRGEALRLEWREALDDVEQKNAYILEKEIYIAHLTARITELEGEMGRMQDELVKAQSSWWHVRRLAGRSSRRLLRVVKMPMKFVALSRSHGFRVAVQQSTRRLSGQRVDSNHVVPAIADAVPITIAPQPVRQERLLVICQAVSAHGWPTRAASLVRAALRAGFFSRWHSPTPLPEHDVSVSGMALFHVDAARLLDEVRPGTRVLLADLSPAAVELAGQAKNRGGEVILDISSVDDGVLSEGIRAKLASLVSRALSREGVSDPRFPDVKVDALPDAADNDEFDSYKTYAYPDNFRKRRRNILVFASGSSGRDQLAALLAVHPSDQIHVVGQVALEDSRIRAVEWHPSMRASMLAAADFIVVITHGETVTEGVRQSVRAALIMERPVISDAPLGVDESKNFHLLAGRSLAEVVDLVTPLEDYRFVSTQAWLGRVEQLMQAGFPSSVSVVVLIYNNAKIIERCVSTILAHCGAWIHEIVVVDNQSADGGAELVERLYAGHPKVKLVRNVENGCSSGRNLGVKESTGDYIAFFDSDQWLTAPSCFAEAIHVLENNPGVGTIGWNAGWFDAKRNDLGGAISDYVPNRGMNAGALSRGYRDDIGFLGTSGMFIKRELFESIAGFDTFYDPTCFEDTDICFQVKKAGYAVAFRDLAGIRHQPHQTTGASEGSERYKQLFNRNAEYFRKKWEGYPDFFVDYLP